MGSGVGVDVGSGVCVAVVVGGVEGDVLLVEQAATRNNTMSRIGNDFFIEICKLHLILIRRSNICVSLGNEFRRGLDNLLTSK